MSPADTFYSTSSQSYADLSKSLSEYSDSALERARQRKAEMFAAAKAVVAAAKASKEAAAAAAAAVPTVPTVHAITRPVTENVDGTVDSTLTVHTSLSTDFGNRSIESSNDNNEIHSSKLERDLSEERKDRSQQEKPNISQEIRSSSNNVSEETLKVVDDTSKAQISTESIAEPGKETKIFLSAEPIEDKSLEGENDVKSEIEDDEDSAKSSEETLPQNHVSIREAPQRGTEIDDSPPLVVLSNESRGDLESVHSKTLTIVIDTEDIGNKENGLMFEKEQNEPGIEFNAPCIQTKNDERMLGSPSVKTNDTSCFGPKSPETLQTRRSLRRVSAIEELMTTEEVYYDYLHILVNHFLSVIGETDCITPEQRQLLVRNGRELFQFQEQFYESLQDAHGDEAKLHNNIVYRGNLTNIARCFIEWAPKFEIYNDFCVLHDQALDLYGELMQNNEAFANLMERLHTFHRVSFGSSNRLQFQDYLIKPFQRLCRYKLLLQQIAKAADKDLEDYELLSKAQDAMHAVTNQIDARKSVLAAERKTKLFLNRLEQDWVNNKIPLGEPFMTESLPRRWFDTLGICTLIGTLEVRCLEYGPKPKRYGCALFQTYMIVVKARKTKTYEPRHWFPIRQFELENVYDTTEPSMSYGWILRSDYHTLEFGAMCESEKQLWMDTLGKAITKAREDHAEQNNKEKSEHQGGGSVVEQLFVSSFDRKPTSSQTSAIIPSSSSYASLSVSRPDLLTQPEVSERAMTRALTVGAQLCRQESIGVETNTTATTESPTTPASQQPQPQQHHHQQQQQQPNMSGLSSPGRRSNSSIDNLKDYFSANVTEKLSQRKYNHYHHRCMVVDMKFDDVCSTPVMTARAQARNDRASSYEQWRRRANIPKTNSMLSFASHRTLEDLESAVLSSPRNRISTDSIHRYQSFGDALRTVVRRKSSLPSRIRTSESGEEMGPHPAYLQPQMSISTPTSSTVREETTDLDRARRGNRIAQLAHAHHPPPPPLPSCSTTQLHLITSPPTRPESTLKQSVPSSNHLVRGSSGFFGKMVEKLTSHRNKRK
ncbi:hypothetical protein EC973_008339 [Apophysomyces ossiformis]|uniref:DH domain-containing protein n=1 Tax=Apophysomyces ossiformis TaxID=679940 RepID=A0A8H7BYP5_9FUNG|nr:hypothetical protein EC973_008339 [Apophysomyces ossiformis]